MSKSSIRVDGLGKEYVVGYADPRHGTFYEVLTNFLAAPWRRFRRLGGDSADEERFWALRDVSFEVQAGEVVGIVGRNGAGKSTLLKILSRITMPTTGRIEVRGRLASLLEVGTGFHPELSGRENIYLNATILGMGRREISRKFDDIVEFSGVARFLDTPVKRYSSGMYVRLAFAVAAYVEADILVVDEVLAVGDAEFQKRCLGMMGDVARGGRTVLFVSHNLTALRNLCPKGILLDNGRLRQFGHIGDVLAEYASMRGTGGHATVDLHDVHPDKPAWIRRVSIVPKCAEPWADIMVSTPIAIRIWIEVRQPGVEIGVYIHCHDSAQNRVFSTGSFFEPVLSGKKWDAGLHEFECTIPGSILNDGEYTIDLMLVRDRQDVFLEEPFIGTFRVHDEPLGVDGWNWPAVGVIRPKVSWTHSVPSSLPATQA